MTIEIRPVHDEELPAYVDAVSSAFLERPDVDRVAEEIRSSWDLARTWAAMDGGRIVGTFRSWATELTVPGLARLPASAISAVTVQPTHRRRGILRAWDYDLHGLTDDADAALWYFLLATDLVTTVKAEGRTPTDRLPWLLTKGRAAVLSDAGEGLWLRLLDIPRALEARTYESAASLVIEIIDPEHAGGRATFRLDAGPDGARCTTISASPDLTIHVAALSAAYLGGSPLRDAVVAHGWDEGRSGALGTADALFGTRRAPWCSTFS